MGKGDKKPKVKCPNGHTVKRKDAFCAKCGSALPFAASAASEVNEFEPSETADPSDEPSGEKRIEAHHGVGIVTESARPSENSQPPLVEESPKIDQNDSNLTQSRVGGHRAMSKRGIRIALILGVGALTLLVLITVSLIGGDSHKSDNPTNKQESKVSQQKSIATVGRNLPFTWTDSSTPPNNSFASLDTVACSDSKRCIGFSNGEYSTSSDAGRTWATQTFAPSDGDISALSGWSYGPSVVSCHGLVCVAYSDSYGFPPTDIYTISQDGGQTWSVVSVAFPTALDKNKYQVRSVECPSAQVCYVIFDNSNASAGIASEDRPASFIESTTDSGSQWKTLTLDPGKQQTSFFASSLLTSISCPTVTHCVALGESFLPPGPAIFVTNNGGANWSEGYQPGLGLQTTAYTSATCPSSSECFAIGIVSSNQHEVFESSDGGTKWSVSLVAPGASFVSCFSTSTCIVGGESTHLAASLWTTTNSGFEWSQFIGPPGGSFATAACATDKQCVASGVLSVGTLTGVAYSTTPIPAPKVSDCQQSQLFQLASQSAEATQRGLVMTDTPVGTNPITATCKGGWAVLSGFTIQAGSGFGIAIYKDVGGDWTFNMFGDDSNPQKVACLRQFPVGAVQKLGSSLTSLC